jgi:hypothetical protein
MCLQRRIQVQGCGVQIALRFLKAAVLGRRQEGTTPKHLSEPALLQVPAQLLTFDAGILRFTA